MVSIRSVAPGSLDSNSLRCSLLRYPSSVLADCRVLFTGPEVLADEPFAADSTGIVAPTDGFKPGAVCACVCCGVPIPGPAYGPLAPGYAGFQEPFTGTGPVAGFAAPCARSSAAIAGFSTWGGT